MTVKERKWKKERERGTNKERKKMKKDATEGIDEQKMTVKERKGWTTNKPR